MFLWHSKKEYEQGVVYSQWSLNCPKHCSTATRHWKRGTVEGRQCLGHLVHTLPLTVKADCWFKCLKSAYHIFGRCPCHLLSHPSFLKDTFIVSFQTYIMHLSEFRCKQFIYIYLHLFVVFHSCDKSSS